MKPWFQDDTLTLYLGDASSVLSDLPDGTVDCIVTSPPYYGLRQYTDSELEIGREPTPGGYVEDLSKVFRECRRILADDGTFWLNLGDTYSTPNLWDGGDGSENSIGLHGHVQKPNGRKRPDRPAKNLLGIPWRVAFALQDDGWILRSDIIWGKTNPMPESVKDRPSKSYEHIFLFSKTEKYYYDYQSVRQRQSEKTIEDLAHRHTFGNKSAYGGVREDLGRDRREYVASDGRRNLRDVWMLPTRPYAGAHFAAFPADIPLTCIQAGCKPGGVTLDPFNGSGTTGLAAAMLGRRYVGVDLNEQYLELSLRDRLNQPAFL